MIEKPKEKEGEKSAFDSSFEPIYHGAYGYFFKNSLYSEENFQLSKSRHDSSLMYQTELLTRLATGEFLKIYCDYKVTKDYNPLSVTIKKYIGKQQIMERFSPISGSGTTLLYEFKTSRVTDRVEIPVPPKYQVATLDTATTFIFLSSKKYDPTGRNFYNVLVSDNIWEYAAPPIMKFVMMERISNAPIEIQIKNNTLKATHYKAYSMGVDSKKSEIPLNVYLSKHYNIPYLVEGQDGLKIQIRFLEEMERSSAEDRF